MSDMDAEEAQSPSREESQAGQYLIEISTHFMSLWTQIWLRDLQMRTWIKQHRIYIKISSSKVLI